MNFKIALVASALMALAGAVGVAGCGGDDCTTAADHAAEFFPAAATGDTNGATPPACEGAYECQSKCTNSASCDALKGVDLEGQAEYLKCNSECQTQTLP